MRVVDVLSVTLPRCASVAVVVDGPDELRAPEHVGGNVVVWVVVDFDRKGAVVGDAAGGYGDELADCEYAEQRTVLVTFLLEAAQLLRAGARVVLDLVEGWSWWFGSLLCWFCFLVALYHVLACCARGKPRTSCVAWSGVSACARFRVGGVRR